MENNTTLNNMTHTYRWCNIDLETFSVIRLYTYIIASICSFIGNLLVILIVYRNKNLRTSTNYFIVSMSVSDILFPFFKLLFYKLLIDSSDRRLKLVGNLLCKLLSFLDCISYGVSMLTLVVITVYRFSAVMFPLRARVQNKKKRLLVLVLTWVIPMATYSPYVLVYFEFNAQDQSCFWKLNFKQWRLWRIGELSLFSFLPLLIMLVLYPIIIIKLKQHRVPGNVTTLQTQIRKKRQNFRLTMMFIVITAAFLLCWGPYIAIEIMIIWMIDRNSSNITLCISAYLYYISFITRVVFHAINPVIYFIFLSSFRQGFKNIFRSSFCSRTRPQAPADNFELKNIPQGLHNS